MAQNWFNIHNKILQWWWLRKFIWFDGLIQITNSLRLTFDVLKNYNQEPTNYWINSEITLMNIP